MPREREIKGHLEELLRRRATQKGLSPDLVTDDANLLDAGVLDSMAFFEILGEIELKFRIEVSFADVVPGAFSTLAGMAAQCAKFGTAK